ncbi:hypothetical protein [uncultured Ruminococcus sp.]|uniref:hypothetical protein n=1 Tax=uncultured Ruminococcus sp. TaxID=165186 RepID=UPI0025E38635|nr:hypothetical protein [uncultured Ruminococcus sp.]
MKAAGDADETNRQLYDKVAALLKKIMPEEEYKYKKITTYEEWRTRNEKTS